MSPVAQRSILFSVFFLSGLTGLIYESLWSHYLKLFLGHAAYAQTLVLAIFMGGMALGAALASAVSGRLRNLLAAYAIAEVCIGVFAMAFHFLFTGLIDVSFARVIPSLGSPAAVDAYRWAIAVLLLLPPSILLGTTFPLMSSAVIRRFPGREGGNLATLYFTNSLGAAAGALVASFVLIGWLGLPGTLQLAGVLNLLIGAVAGALARGSEPAPIAVPTDSATGRFPVLLLAASFVTGAASFIYEVSWIRMLSLVLGSTFHAFELMLSAFIAGLALGSLAIRRHIDRIANPLAAAAWIQVGMGVFAVLTLPVYAQSFEWMGTLVNTLPKDSGGYALFNLASHGIAFAVMLPATFLAGMTLPLFTHVLLRSGHGEKSIGRIYAANTLGAIVGVLFSIHFALPAMGLKLTLSSGALLDIALGLLLLHFAAARRGDWLMAFCAFAVPVAVVRLVVLDPVILSSGVYRTGDARPQVGATLFYRDGKTATISVFWSSQSTLVLSSNGKPDASIEMNPALPAADDELTMVMAAAVPMAMRPDATSIANIGFGSGLTTHAALANPNLKEIATIESEQAVIEGARGFLPRVSRAYRDPRSQIFIEDAKSWFARHNRRFDIIISEPSNPWVSGVASLFSDEFYLRIRDYLDERGLFVQWLNLYEFDIRLAASVVAALNRNFSDYAMYITDESNLLIVAAKTGTVPPISDALFALPLMREELSRVGIRTLDDLALRRLGSAATLSPMLQALGAPVNSDYYPYVELMAPKSRFLKSAARELPLLGVFPLPLIEMLERQGARWHPVALTPTKGWRYAKVREARELRSAILGGGQVEPLAVERVTQWKVRLGDCAALDRDEGLGAIHELAVATLAFLDAESLRPLWRQPTWLPCPEARWPESVRQRLDLYRAIGERDGAGMLAAARGSLALPSGSSEWRRYAFTAGLLAARSAGDDAAVQELWRRHGLDLYADRKFSPELVMLLTLR
jgi:predicted membrane-bound spermidine synthase